MELCIGKVWGTVCDPYFWSSGFARVVCRQLGFEVDQGAGAFSDSKQMLMLSLPLTKSDHIISAE